MSRSPLLLVALLVGACTADFFVGPEAGGSSGMDTTTASTQDPSTTLPNPSASSTEPPTRGGSTDPTNDATLGETTTGETGEPSTTTDGGTAETTAADTETPPDCEVETAKACEDGFPTCLWNGEVCSNNPCNVGGELDCLAEAPDCIWEAGGCVPSGCMEEAECSPLELAVCEVTKGCLVVIEQCFSLPCVPCQEVENVDVCQELPNCAYDELRAACLPQ